MGLNSRLHPPIAKPHRSMLTQARAHPNVALVKYWGKSDLPGNIPATPSVSVTLGGLHTTTSVQTSTQDSFVLNGAPSIDQKIERLLGELRKQANIPPLDIESTNNFPTAAGLASSASGFAALIAAINTHCELGFTEATCSQWARRASASAARSFCGGFVTLQGPQWQAVRLAPADHWDLKVVIAVTQTSPKTISSSDGMRLSKSTSPYFDAWQSSTETDFLDACDAIKTRDFSRLADVAQSSCLKMHGLMLATRPALLYWNPATIACIHATNDLRLNGIDVFFTIDAGPQIKAVCRAEHSAQVAACLAEISGVKQTLISDVGGGVVVEKRT